MVLCLKIPPIPTFNNFHLLLHIIEGTCSISTIGLMAKIILLQIQYNGTIPNTLIVVLSFAVISSFLLFLLFFFPFLYEKTHLFKNCASFFIDNDTNLCLPAFNVIFWLIAASCITAYVHPASGCGITLDTTDPNITLNTTDPNYSNYTTDLQISCTAGNAVIGLSWISFVAWIFSCSKTDIEHKTEFTRKHTAPV